MKAGDASAAAAAASAAAGRDGRLPPATQADEAEPR